MNNTSIPDKAGVLIFPPLLYFIFLMMDLSLSYFFPFVLLPRTIAIAIGIPLLLVALLLVTRAARMMVKNNTTVNPSGSTTTIVKEGIYKYSRNPMYLSMTLLFVGVSIIMNAWIGLMLIVPLLVIVQKGIIEREEQYLKRKFGQQYLNYKSKVRRWV